MRIAWFIPGGVSAAGTPDHNPVLTDLARRIGSAVELSVFAFSAARREGTTRLDGNTIHHLPVRVDDPPLRRAVSLLRAFRREHRLTPYSAIHAFWALPSGVHAASLGRMFGVPSVVTFPGGDTASLPGIRYGNLLRRRSRAYTRFVCRTATSIHLLTDYQLRQLQATGLSSRQTTVQPFGTDTEQFTGVPATPSRPYRFLHVSNITEVKDQETLLRAFRSIVDDIPATLRIIGPDHMNGTVQRSAADMGIGSSVEFLGWVPHRELPEHYRRSHVYLHTSLHEGQSVSIVEAMACGIPVAGTRVGILSDLPSSCASTVPPGDSAGLARAVLTLLNDRSLFLKQALDAQTWARDHTSGHTSDALVRMYQGIVRGTAS